MAFEENNPPELRALRSSIDNLDTALIHLLAERFKTTRKIGEYKLAHNLPPVAPERENAQIERIRNIAIQAGLEPELAQGILEFIIREVVARHRNLKPEANRRTT
ncbi:MAG TPA: chorismate mutase [Pseudoduganella sp.]|jgi:chorismate mutase